MKKILVAAAIIVGSCSLALAQGGGGGAGAGAGGGGVGAGGDTSTPRTEMKGQKAPKRVVKNTKKKSKKRAM